MATLAEGHYTGGGGVATLVGDLLSLVLFFLPQQLFSVSDMCKIASITVCDPSADKVRTVCGLLSR